jgi:tetratricopeptide (TPR) repeat protein
VAGVLLRLAELEAVLGRYGRALQLAERLLELAGPAGASTPLWAMVARADTLGLVAECLAAVGQAEDAVHMAGEVGAALGGGVPSVDGGIRAARAMCEVGRSAEALTLIDQLPALPGSLLEDYAGQSEALRARALAPMDPSAARDLANEVLARGSPVLTIRSARIKLDAALALHESGADSAARNAVKRGLKALQGSGNKGLKLELLVAMYLASPDLRVVEAVARTAEKIIEDLPPILAASFRHRKVVGAALERFKEP